MQQVSIRMFAAARELAGADVVEVDLPEGCTVAELRSRLVERYPRLAPLAAHLLLAVDAEYAVDSQVVRRGADVACIPPVSGG